MSVSYIKNEAKCPTGLLLLVTGLLLAAGCGELKPNYETPTINVSYFRPLPGTGIAPRFGIGLHVINPNDFALEVRGISYTVSLQGQKIVVGVARDLPTVPAYGEADIDLQAATDVISSIKLITGLMRDPQQVISYELDARLDIKGFARKVHVVREGEFSFAGRK